MGLFGRIAGLFRKPEPKVTLTIAADTSAVGNLIEEHLDRMRLNPTRQGLNDRVLSPSASELNAEPLEGWGPYWRARDRAANRKLQDSSQAFAQAVLGALSEPA